MADQIPNGPWHDTPDDWDKVELAGKVWPGLAMVEVDRANKWDTKKAQGSHGGEREYKGADLAPVRIEIRYWTTEHHEQVREFLPDIEPVPGKKKQDAVSIKHAVTILRKVESITVDNISGPKVSNGIGTITITATEYRKPTSEHASGTASGKFVGGDPRNAQGNCATLQDQYAHAVGSYATESARLNSLMAIAASNGDTYQSDGSATRAVELAVENATRAAQAQLAVEQQKVVLQDIGNQIREIQGEMERNGCNQRSPGSSDEANDP